MAVISSQEKKKKLLKKIKSYDSSQKIENAIHDMCGAYEMELQELARINRDLNDTIELNKMLGASVGKQFPKSIFKFIKSVKSEIEQEGGEIVLTPERYLVDGVRVNGCFDRDGKILRCSTSKNLQEWFTVFLHEYGHFLQSKNNTKAEQNLAIGKDDSLTQFFEWLQLKDIDSNCLSCYFERVVAYELECEKLTVKVIEECNLPICTSAYKCNANAYLFFYAHAFSTRKWYTIGKEPYRNLKVMCAMPDKFMPLRSYLSPSKKIVKLYQCHF